ncbi:hypothetical protein Q5752_004387 [Cryptotrichosporon argae]
MPIAIRTPAPVRTAGGLIQGYPSEYRDGVTVYKGIPYAASTAGANRWRAPQPREAWDGVFDAKEYGAVCPQLPFGPIEIDNASEDCLSLNVFTPALADAALPVYVWIYGGRFIAGSGSQPTFEGSGLAAKGVVVVTLNYRVGILGFLASPELDEESGVGSSGNYGILDQQAALRWVQANIAAFGGDPAKVTIGGQSAGGASTGIHVLSPLSKGLFRAAIPQAGKRSTHDPLLSGLAPSYRTKEKALRQGLETIAEKGAANIAEMRALDIDHLLVGNNKNDDQWGNPPFYRPNIDGHVLPYNYTGCLSHGTQSDVPIMTGHNSDEGGTYADPDFGLNDFRACAQQKYGAFVDRFLALYSATTDEEARDAWNAAARDNSRVTVSLWAKQFAEHASSPVYGYFFAQAPPPRVGGPDGRRVKPVESQSDEDKAKAKVELRIYEQAVPRSTYTYSKIGPGARFGAFHGAEIPYVFDNLDAQIEYTWRDEDRQVAETTSSYWVNFIKTGNPNGKGLPAFPTCDGSIMHLGKDNYEMPLAATPERAQFWSDYLQAQKAW